MSTLCVGPSAASPLRGWRSHQYEAAWEAYRRASSYLSVEAIQNTESAGVLYNNIGMLLISENRVEEAGPYLEEALKIQSHSVSKTEGICGRVT